MQAPAFNAPEPHSASTVWGIHTQNHRIQKYVNGSYEEITICRGSGEGKNKVELYEPRGVFVDLDKNIYIADTYNHRIQNYVNGSNEGIIICGGNGKGNGENQLRKILI